MNTQAEVLRHLRSIGHALETVRGGYPDWAELCGCVDARLTDCELCNGSRWVKGTEPYCLDCEHSGCPFCPGWCDVLESKHDPDIMCCDTECRYPVDKPPPPYWDVPPDEPEPEETLKERVARHESEALERRKVDDASAAARLKLQKTLAKLGARQRRQRRPYGDVWELKQLFLKLPDKLQDECIDALGDDDAMRMLDIFSGKKPAAKLHLVEPSPSEDDDPPSTEGGQS